LVAHDNRAAENAVLGAAVTGLGRAQSVAVDGPGRTGTRRFAAGLMLGSGMVAPSPTTTTLRANAAAANRCIPALPMMSATSTAGRPAGLPVPGTGRYRGQHV
jgi:hypothetical protein